MDTGQTVEIVGLEKRMDVFDTAVEMFWKQWGSADNRKFYYDCMLHSCKTGSDLPRFYIALEDDNTIVGTYALLRNELVSRQDIFPWLACLYIAPERRGNKLGAALLQHALREAAQKGYENLYLCTDLERYYEKYGWDCLGDGYIFNGDPTKIYVHPTM